MYDGGIHHEEHEDEAGKLLASLSLSVHAFAKVAELNDMKEGDRSPVLSDEHAIVVAQKATGQNSRTPPQNDHCRLANNNRIAIGQMDAERAEGVILKANLEVFGSHVTSVILAVQMRDDKLNVSDKCPAGP